ncbi:hypothetical protein M378DRAFT_168325 [Amanita muscaria Koide BX008]|uniref:Cytochrome P450 n=1 Tax=Amanita muscaria (strain Koide BX008) TaxID=946122 RepID=A0A0C2T1G6_AMAMK|nr:hypothetical protein M378DRAFT_168325 [Amanita muscaria Koide BX008]
MFVGLPLCRNPDWVELNKKLTFDLIKATIIHSCIPACLRHIVAPLLIPKGFQRGAEYLEPLIRERLEQEAQHGKDWPQRPNDIISWMIDATKDRPRSNLELVKAILMTNFAALHTTTMSFTYVMYELATRPEYVQPLREEIEAVTGEEGWSRDAMHKLWKVDSFIKECLRVSNFAAARMALKDLTFSNGMTIPAGNMIGVPFDAIHTDANNYVDPESFDGFRFEKMRSQEGENIKHQIMSLSPDFILFGHGRQACPGRFFVANELKAMLAHALLVKYDFKMANGRGRPSNWQFWIFMVPDVTAKILFRKRTAA